MAIRNVLAALFMVAAVTAPFAVSAAEGQEESVQVDRLAGGNRYETAALISTQFPGGADTVYLVNGEDWAQGADAVVAGAAAGSDALHAAAQSTGGIAA